jgi:hypothetical protein
MSTKDMTNFLAREIDAAAGDELIALFKRFSKERQTNLTALLKNKDRQREVRGKENEVIWAAGRAAAKRQAAESKANDKSMQSAPDAAAFAPLPTMLTVSSSPVIEQDNMLTGPTSLLSIGKARAATTESADAESHSQDQATPRVDKYLRLHGNAIARSVFAKLQDSAWRQPGPDLPWTGHGQVLFLHAIIEQLERAVGDFSNPAQLQRLLYPNNPQLAFETYALPLITADKHQGWKAWSENFGEAMGYLFESALFASMKRMGPRFRDALVRLAGKAVHGKDLIASHPLDPYVGNALLTGGLFNMVDLEVSTKEQPLQQLHDVTVQWLGESEPTLWNYVRATPATATAEDVAATLYHDKARSTEAFALSKQGDVFRIEVEHARQLVPKKWQPKQDVVAPTKAHQVAAA